MKFFKYKYYWIAAIAAIILAGCLAKTQDIETVRNYLTFYNRAVGPSGGHLTFNNNFNNDDNGTVIPRASLVIPNGALSDSIIVNFYEFSDEDLTKAVEERGISLITPFIYFVPLMPEWINIAKDSAALRRNVEGNMNLRLFESTYSFGNIDVDSIKLYKIRIPNTADFVGDTTDTGLHPDNLFSKDGNEYLTGYDNQILKSVISGYYPRKFPAATGDAISLEFWEIADTKVISGTQEFGGAFYPYKMTPISNFDFIYCMGEYNDEDNEHRASWSSLDDDALESAGLVRVRLAVSSFLSTDTSKVYIELGGSALRGMDYTIVEPDSAFSNFYIQNDTLIIKPGIKNIDIEVKLIDDIIYEIDESVTFTIVGTYNVDIGDDYEMILTISENDGRELYFSPSEGSSEENHTLLTNVTVNVSQTDPNNDITFDYEVIGGTATKGTDYIITEGSKTIPKGQNKAYIGFFIVNDQVFEPAETFIIRILNPVNALAATENTYTHTINASDGREITFLEATGTLKESEASYELQILLTSPDPDKSTIIEYTVSGTAISDTDYSGLANGTITFAPNKSLEKLSFTITNDKLVETDETIVLTLKKPINGTLGNVSEYEITLEDDDSRRIVFFKNADNNFITENTVEKQRFNVILSKVDNLNTTLVDLAFSGTALVDVDYTVNTKQLVFEPGASTQELEIAFINDVLLEGPEGIFIDLISVENCVTGNYSRADITLYDDDQSRNIYFAASALTVIEADTVVGVKVSLSEIDTYNDTFFDLFIENGADMWEGEDYGINSSTPVTIPKGTKSIVLNIGIKNDAFAENTETAVFTITNSINCNSSSSNTFTLTINDDGD